MMRVCSGLFIRNYLRHSDMILSSSIMYTAAMNKAEGSYANKNQHNSNYCYKWMVITTNSKKYFKVTALKTPVDRYTSIGTKVHWITYNLDCVINEFLSRSLLKSMVDYHRRATYVWPFK